MLVPTSTYCGIIKPDIVEVSLAIQLLVSGVEMKTSRRTKFKYLTRT